jgi:hypothetical protein
VVARLGLDQPDCITYEVIDGGALAFAVTAAREGADTAHDFTRTQAFRCDSIHDVDQLRIGAAIAQARGQPVRVVHDGAERLVHLVCDLRRDLAHAADAQQVCEILLLMTHLRLQQRVLL